MEQRKFDLEDRLVKFACQSLEICDLLPNTRINLRIIVEKPVLTNEKLHIVLQEANELIAIFLKSVETAKQNLITEKLKK